MPTNFLDLAGCIIPDKEEVSAASNAQRLIICPTKHSAFYVKPSCSKGEAKTNVSTNKLTPDKQGLIRTENSITTLSKDRQTSINLKNNAKLGMVPTGHSLGPTIKMNSIVRII